MRTKGIGVAAVVFGMVMGCGTTRQAKPSATESGGEVVASGGATSTGGDPQMGGMAETGGTETGGRSDSGSASCDELKTYVHEQIHVIEHGAETSCDQDADCVEVAVEVSCLSECLLVLTLERERSALESRVAALDRDYCSDEAGAPRCTVARPGNCGHRPPAQVIRCIEHTCVWTRPGCAEGCTVGADDLCHGEPDCEGCPYEIEYANGQPCAREGQICLGGYDYCDLVLECGPDAEGRLVYHQYACL